MGTQLRGHCCQQQGLQGLGGVGVFPNRIHFFLPRGNAGGRMGRTGPRRALVTAIDIHHCATRGALRVGQWWDPWGQVCTGILEHHSQRGLLSPSPFPPAQFLGPTTLLGLPQPMGASSATRPQRTHGCRCLAHHQPRPRKPQQVSKHHPHVNLQSNKTTPKPQPVPAAVPSTSMQDPMAADPPPAPSCPS